MADAKDADGVVFESEQDTVIAKPEPERSRRAIAGEAENSFKQAHGGGLVYRANIGFSFIKPLDPVWWHLLVKMKIFGLQPELGEDFFHRNTLAVLCKPSLPFAKALAIFLGYSLIVRRRRGQGAADGGRAA